MLRMRLKSPIVFYYTCDTMSVSNIDVEQVFSDFVERYGGIVSDRIPTEGNKSPNADYIFHKEKVVAELKLLKNPYQNKEFRKSHAQKEKDWVQRGYITDAELRRVKKISQLPDECYLDI